MDMAAWDAETNAACIEALSRLNLATNPSGVCVCYNLPVLLNSTGEFEADLRLYKLNEPSGQFVGIPPEKIQVSLAYEHAAVGMTSASSMKRDLGVGTTAEIVGLESRELAKREVAPLQTYFLKGQIDKTLLTGDMDQ